MMKTYNKAYIKVNQSVNNIAYSVQLHNTVACSKSQLKRFIHA